MRNRLCLTLLFCVLGTVAPRGSAADVIVDLEDLALAPESFNNGSDGAGGFTSQGTFFENSFTDFGGGFTSWSGWSFSNVTDVTTPGFGNQYSAFHLPSGGGDASANFAIAFVDSFNPSIREIVLPAGTDVLSMRITNTTYAALSMRDGDGFAKKFGDDPLTEGITETDFPDFFLLSVIGLDGSNAVVGPTLEFYLADYRFALDAQDYIVSGWTDLDLLPLSGLGVRSLTFNLESSDVGGFGMNTPSYFALDNLTLSSVPEPSSLLLAGGLALGALAWRRFRRSTTRK